MTTIHDLEDFQPTASWTNLRLYGDLLRRVRRFFESRDFLEVVTPLLSRDTVVDRHIDPFPVQLDGDGRNPGSGPAYFLQTSPEFHMKRLLAAGANAIYQVTRAFRAAERGTLHNPEFTIVEWYRQADSMREGIDLLNEFAQSVLQCPAAELLSYQNAFQRHANIDPLNATTEQLNDVVTGLSLSTASHNSPDRDTMLNLILDELIQPKLGVGRPTILFDYPASQAALAKVRRGQPSVAERFELFVEGVELANGYHELLDPRELLKRNREINAQRRGDGKRELPSESRLSQAMRHGLPPCCGVALGFDRLVMLAAGARTIDEVISFPIERA